MSCSKTQLEISAGVDSGQPFEPLVQRHLKSCSACREFLADQQEWDLLFEKVVEADPSPPAYLWTKIENEIRRRDAVAAAPARSGFGSSLGGWLQDFVRIPIRISKLGAALAALVLVAALGVGVTQFHDDGLGGLDQMVAQYRPPIAENPWLEVDWTENPFLDAYAERSPNPFADGE